MPRLVIGTPKRDEATTSRPGANARITPSTGHARHQVGMRLREKRSRLYVESMQKVDAGTYAGDRAALASLLEAITAEFPDLGVDERPIGILSKCYLGAPFEVHVCDLTGSILEHYEVFRQLPAPYSGARSLATHPAYAFVEVYADGYRAVADDGTVSVVPL